MSIPIPEIYFVPINQDEVTIRNSLVPPLKHYIEQNFGILNGVQIAAIPRIKEYQSTLVMSPTGSGKTLAAFLGIINELHLLEKNNKLEEKIYVLYISPLKALNNDIHKNLEIPLEHIKRLSNTNITTAKRTGDTTAKERARIARKPPHILITTPESFALMLTAPKFKEKLRFIKWLIVDEIHSLANNKRGTLLSLCIERLEYYLPSPLTRIGLSATIEPSNLIAHYLIGNRKTSIGIVDFGHLREIDIDVISPLTNLVNAPYNLIKKRHIELINQFVQENTTNLIFTNTRHLSEKLAYELIKLHDESFSDKVAVHHGSLDAKVRLSVEENLKQGRMKAVFTSTSLELGIDIGSIDLTIQLGSSKTVRSLLQRIGRSGHSQNLVSRGKILVFNRDDLVECTAIGKLALEGKIDSILIPNSPVDVLIQMLVGMAVEKKWDLNEAYNVVHKSYSYRNLSKNNFLSIIEAASNPTDDENGWKYGHIWYDPETMQFGKRKRARQSYMQNIGTIPETTAIGVILEGFRTRIGMIAERFAENLTKNDIFLLGGRTYQFVRSVGNKIIVKEVYGHVPTVPSWTGEAQSRTWEVSLEISKLISKIDTFIRKDLHKKAIEWVQHTYPVGEKEATCIVNYQIEQNAIAPSPTMNRIILESYYDPSGSLNILVLAIFGKETNSIIAQALAANLTDVLNSNIGIITTDNGFLLRLAPGLEFDYSQLFSLLQYSNLENILSKHIMQTELFKHRFRHVASRSLIILKRRGVQKISINQQQQLARWILGSLSPESPFIKETIREILYDTYNLELAKNVINKIKSKEIEIISVPSTGIPSPLTHDIILNGTHDVVLMEDRRSLLISLHKQVLSRLLPEVKEYKTLLSKDIVNKYFKSKLQFDFHKDIVKTVLAYVEFTKITYTNFFEVCSNYIGVSIEEIKNIVKTNPDIIALPGRDDYTTLEILPFYGAMNPSNFWDNFDYNDLRIAHAIELSGEISPNTAWEQLIIYYLKYAGPQTIDKISYDLGLKENKLIEILWILQRKTIILSGNFVSENREYILYEDRESIIKLKLDPTQISEEVLRQFRINKMRLSRTHQSNKISALQYLKENGPCRDPIELVARLPLFDWVELRKYLLNREVYFGRFLGRRLVFIHNEHLKDFVTIVRSHNKLDIHSREILELISKIPGISLKEIKNVLKQSHSKIQNEINKLEQELYISRTGWDLTLTHGGFPQPRFIALPEINIDENSYDNAVCTIITLCCKWYGFLMLNDIMRITRLPYAVIEAALKKLDEVLITKVIYTYIYYGLPDDLRELETLNPSKTGEIHLLSPYDPFFYTHGGSFESYQLPRKTRLTIVQNGLVAGNIEISIPDKDILQVLNLQFNKKYLENSKFIRTVGMKLLDLSIKAYHVQAIFIEEIRFKSANHDSNRYITSILKDVGYKLKVDHLVAGTTISENYIFIDILETRQINHGYIKSQKFNDVTALFEKIPVLNVSDALLLLNESISNARLILSNALRKGIIHHAKNILYRHDLWLTLPRKQNDLDNTILRELIEPISLNQLLKKLHIESNFLKTQIFKAIHDGIIEIISPFDRIPEYRLVNTNEKLSKPKLKLEWIIYLIDIKGPLSFTKLRKLIRSYLPVSRIEVLLLLIELVKQKRIYSAIVDIENESVLFYFNKKQKNVLENPTRKQQLDEWKIFERNDDIFDEIPKNYTHILTQHGNPIISFIMKHNVDEAIIEDLIFQNQLLSKNKEIILELFAELEKYFFSLGFQGIRIKKIQSAFPNYWLDLAGMDD